MYKYKLWYLQAGFRKGRGTRDQTANIFWIIEKTREFQKKHLLLHWLHQSLWLCGSHKLWKILNKKGIPDHLSCLLRHLYAGQEATVRTGRGTMNWFKIGKGVRQGCILSPCLFNLYESTSCKMPGWMKHNLQSRLPGEISTASDM